MPALTHDGFAHGARVGGGIDCAVAAAATAAGKSSPFASVRILPLTGASLEPDGGYLVGGTAALVIVGCLLDSGATVPDSAPDGADPLCADRVSVLWDGSIMPVGAVAQGAMVPMAGVGMAGPGMAEPLLAPGPAVPAPEPGMLVAWLADGRGGARGAATFSAEEEPSPSLTG